MSRFYSSFFLGLLILILSTCYSEENESPYKTTINPEVLMKNELPDGQIIFNDHLATTSGGEFPKEEEPSSEPVLLEKQNDPSLAFISNSNMNFPNKKCIKTLGIFALADQLNQSMIDGGLSYSRRFISTSDSCFPYFYAPLGINLWMRPYFFHAKSREKKNNFNMTTLGFQGGGEWSIFDFLTLGWGLGYYHSSLDQNLGLHGINFGPSLSALFGQGVFSFSTFWSSNHYEGKIKLCGKKRGVDHNSWDRTIRFEGGWNISLPQSIVGELSIYPFGKVDFLKVSESAYKISYLGKVKEHKSGFCNFDFGAKLTKALFCTKNLFLLPSLLFGFHSIHPFHGEKFSVSTNEEKIEGHFNPESTLQFLFEGEVLALINKGLLIGIDYQSRSGGKYPLKGGKIRIEWNF